MQTFRLITAAAVSGTDSFGRRVLSYEPQMEEGGGGGAPPAWTDPSALKQRSKWCGNMFKKLDI